MLDLDAIDGATGYKIYRGDASGDETLLKTITGADDDATTTTTPEPPTTVRRTRPSRHDRRRAPASASASRSIVGVINTKA